MDNIEVIKSILMNHDDEASLTNYERCKHCSNVYEYTCCSSFPCEINASDLIEVTKENVKKLLESGLVIIDRWEDNMCDKGNKFVLPETYYLRMRGDKDSKCFDVGWNFYGNKCLCLGEGDNGCKLPFCHRPYYGRMFDCESFPREELCSGKFDAAKSWFPYQDILYNVMDELMDDAIE